mgnify:CR=1 FL=1
MFQASGKLLPPVAPAIFASVAVPTVIEAPPEATGATIDHDDEEPLLLTNRVKPKVREWNVANRLFQHVRGCRCSTCRLSAELAAMIRLTSTSKRGDALCVVPTEDSSTT